MFAVCMLRSRCVDNIVVGPNEAEAESYYCGEDEGEAYGGSERLCAELIRCQYCEVAYELDLRAYLIRKRRGDQVDEGIASAVPTTNAGRLALPRHEDIRRCRIHSGVRSVFSMG